MPNTSIPPTDNLMFRKAVQAALNMDEIMDAASDGNYELNVGFQYPNQPDYTDAGKETYNLHDPALAKKYLAQSGYKGEPVVLLTDKDYPPMYNSALVMQQQLQAIGINAQMKVVDWPTSVQHGAERRHGLELLLHRLGHAARARRARHHGVLRAAERRSIGRRAARTIPKCWRLWNDMNTLPTVRRRQKAFAAMQKYVLDQVYAVPFGSLTKVQAVRSNVKGFVPFRIPRMSNVWFAN